MTHYNEFYLLRIPLFFYHAKMCYRAKIIYSNNLSAIIVNFIIYVLRLLFFLSRARIFIIIAFGFICNTF